MYFIVLLPKGGQTDFFLHLNITSLSSGLFTNFGSIRDPFSG